MGYDIEIQTVEEQPILAISAIAPPQDIPTKLGEFFPEIAAFISRSEVEMAGMPLAVWRSFGEQGCDFDAAIPVSGQTVGAGRIQFRRLPGGRVATTLHRGPYQNLPAAHQAVAAWMREQGHEPAAAPWEQYINDPGCVPDPADYETRIFYPIK